MEARVREQMNFDPTNTIRDEFHYIIYMYIQYMYTRSWEVETE